MIKLAKVLNKQPSHIIANTLCAVLVGIGTALAEPRALGVSAPLSGGGAGWGNDFKNVLTFANEKLAAGQYKLVFEDDRCENKSALSVAQKFSSVDKVKEVFIFCGQVAMATAKKYRGAGITMMAPLSTPSRISELGVFRTGLNDALASKELANYITRNHKSVFILTEEDDYAVAFQNDFLKAARELSLNTSYETYLPQETDFRPLLLRLKAARVEALFLNTQAEQALGTLVKQLNELQFFPQLYGAYLPGSAGFLKLGGKFAEGLVFVDFPAAQEFLTPDGKALYSEFIARFGPLKGWSFTFPAAFEGFRAIHLGLQNGGDLEQYLHEAKFDGVFGPYTFDNNGDVIGPKHVLRVIHGGMAKALIIEENKGIAIGASGGKVKKSI
jgi:ABC-type branched-subunit amino acid transport system substrate-binding protein